MGVDEESCELLRAIARSADADQIHQAAVRVREWNSLLQLAHQHRVLPMLFCRLGDMGPTVPQMVQEWVRAEYERNVLHNLVNAAELISVLKALEQEGIPAMPFKGIVLGASVYPDPATRPAGDIDLLIYYKDLQQATAALLKRGYELVTQVDADGVPTLENYYEYHFERRTDGMVTELRWRLELTQPRYKKDLGMNWVWPGRRSAIVAGVEVPNMSPEITLLMLCMHACKHLWSRMIWICDVGRLITSAADLDWKEVIRESQKTGLGRALALGVLLAHRVAGASVPKDILRRFEADSVACGLAEHIEKNLFDAPGSTPVGRIPYNIQLLDFRGRVSLLLSPDWMRPNERDKAVLRLPKPLHALYYLVRPFRILWDRSAR